MTNKNKNAETYLEEFYCLLKNLDCNYKSIHFAPPS